VRAAAALSGEGSGGAYGDWQRLACAWDDCIQLETHFSGLGQRVCVTRVGVRGCRTVPQRGEKMPLHPQVRAMLDQIAASGLPQLHELPPSTLERRRS
jgi:hypothetical protein